MNSVLTLTQQLRDAQEKLRSTEVRCKALEGEVERLRAASAVAPPRQHEGELLKRIASLEAEQRDLLATPQRAAAIDGTGDGLVGELRRQVVDLLRRNTVLEREAVERTNGLRRQYESHIDALELELRRAKTLATAYYPQRRGPPAPTSPSNAGPAVANFPILESPPAASPPTGSHPTMLSPPNSVVGGFRADVGTGAAAPPNSVVFQSPLPRALPRSSAGRTSDARKNLI